MLSIVPLLLALVLAADPFDASAALESPSRHVRTTDPYAKKLLAKGYAHSATFASLMARLQRSDVIVHVEILPRLPAAMEGRLMLLPRAHDVRYVRIQIALRGSEEDSVAVLGHELQHACEIADAPDVGNEQQMAKLYARIGMRGGAHVFDTEAAQQAGRQVRRELVA